MVISQRPCIAVGYGTWVRPQGFVTLEGCMGPGSQGHIKLILRKRRFLASLFKNRKSKVDAFVYNTRMVYKDIMIFGKYILYMYVRKIDGKIKIAHITQFLKSLFLFSVLLI